MEKPLEFTDLEKNFMEYMQALNILFLHISFPDLDDKIIHARKSHDLSIYSKIFLIDTIELVITFNNIMNLIFTEYFDSKGVNPFNMKRFRDSEFSQICDKLRNLSNRKNILAELTERHLKLLRKYKLKEREIKVE